MKRIISLGTVVACLCGWEAVAQVKVEIEVTRLGVSRTIEVDQNNWELNLRESGLTSITLPNVWRNLRSLKLSGNQLTNFTLPAGLRDLGHLDLSGNQLMNLTLPARLPNLVSLELSGNSLTSLTLPAGLTNLEFLRISDNKLQSLTLPVGLSNLGDLNLSDNQLTNLTLPTGLPNLYSLDIHGNQLTSFTLPAKLPNLVSLDLSENQITSLTLPKDSCLNEHGSSDGRPFNLHLVIGNAPLRSLRMPTRLKGKVLLCANSYSSCFFDTDSSSLLDITYIPPVELAISRVGNGLEISWDEDNVVLQSAHDVDGPWHDVSDKSPVKIHQLLVSSIPTEFFRLRAEDSSNRK